MKSLIYFTILNLIVIIIAKNNSLVSVPSNACSITLMDDDSWGKDNKTFYSRVAQTSMAYDLREDVKNIIVKNNLSRNYKGYKCVYNILVCKRTLYRTCKRFTGELNQGRSNSLTSSYIKNINSIQGTSTVHAPPKPKPAPKREVEDILKVVKPIQIVPVVRSLRPTRSVKPDVKPPQPKKHISEPIKQVKPTPRKIVIIPSKPKPIVNREKGSLFCATNCESNPAEKDKKCYINKDFHKCKRCTSKSTIKDLNVKTICASLCNSINGDKCNIYGYNNNKLKNFNKDLLKKFGFNFAKRFFK